MRNICWPCGVLKTAVTSENPCASAGLISAIFQVSSWFQPNICFKKPSTVASLGRLAFAAGEAALVWATVKAGVSTVSSAITTVGTACLQEYLIVSFQFVSSCMFQKSTFAAMG